MDDSLRVDVLLHRLCLTRSRSEAKAACDAGAVLVDGRAVKASHEAAPGDRLELRFPRRTLLIELESLPGRSTSRKAARELYHVLRSTDPKGGEEAAL